MKKIPLSQVVKINPRLPKGLNDSEEISFVPMASVSENGGITHQDTRAFGEVKKGFTYFQRDDVLLAKITPCFENGKSALANNLEHPVGFGSTEFHILRAIPGKLDTRFLYHLVRCKQLLYLGQKSMKGAAGHKRVPADFLEKFEVPEWSINDQIRIAHLLGKVEGLITQRKQHLQQLDDLLKSVFFDMFGDPVRNDEGWDTVPFHKAGKFVSGGTPSKSRDDFWNGDFPWVSPKDMKVTKINDTIDHISESVFGETSLKRIAPDHLLIVVRGMILAHSFPVAINTVDIAINQDMKAIKPVKGLKVVYFLNCLTSLKRQILKLISTAGHGTRKFDSIAMQKLFIPKPPIELQDQFATIVEKVEALKSRYQQSLSDLESLYGALSQQAFKGELDLSRVPLPGNEANKTEKTIEESLIKLRERFKILPEIQNTLNALGLSLPEFEEILAVSKQATEALSVSKKLIVINKLNESVISTQKLIKPLNIPQYDQFQEVGELSKRIIDLYKTLGVPVQKNQLNQNDNESIESVRKLNSPFELPKWMEANTKLVNNTIPESLQPPLDLIERSTDAASYKRQNETDDLEEKQYKLLNDEEIFSQLAIEFKTFLSESEGEVIHLGDFWNRDVIQNLLSNDEEVNKWGPLPPTDLEFWRKTGSLKLYDKVKGYIFEAINGDKVFQKFNPESNSIELRIAK
jgi:type I restriction enzyme S subunit